MATRDVFSGQELAKLRGFPEIGRSELIRYFTLTPADEAFVRKFRGQGNVLGAAVQLCTLSWLGFVPHEVAAAPGGRGGALGREAGDPGRRAARLRRQEADPHRSSAGDRPVPGLADDGTARGGGTCVTSSLPPPAGRSCRCGVPANAGRRHKDRQHAQDVAGQTP